MRHLPEGTHSLAPRPGSLVRLAFQKWSAWQELHLQPSRFERGASSLGYTRMARRAVAQSEGWCPRSDLHRHSARFKCAVSALDYVGGPQRLKAKMKTEDRCRFYPLAFEMVLPAGLSPATTTFEASHSDTLSYGSEKKCRVLNAGCRVSKTLIFNSSLITLNSSLKMVGRLGFAPSSRRLRAGTSLSKFATQSRHEGGVEPPRPGL